MNAEVDCGVDMSVEAQIIAKKISQAPTADWNAEAAAHLGRHTDNLS